VQICLIKDDINFHRNSLPFEKFTLADGKLFTISDDKMHHKFCVIDESIVITGSYNWTYRAAKLKDENIIVVAGDLDLVQKFKDEFIKITKQNRDDLLPRDISRLLKRCEV